jgi:hypothetical protein
VTGHVTRIDSNAGTPSPGPHLGGGRGAGFASAAPAATCHRRERASERGREEREAGRQGGREARKGIEEWQGDRKGREGRDGRKGDRGGREGSGGGGTEGGRCVEGGRRELWG